MISLKGTNFTLAIIDFEEYYQYIGSSYFEFCYLCRGINRVLPRVLQIERWKELAVKSKRTNRNKRNDS